MVYNFEHIISTGEKSKFSVWKSKFKKDAYYARVIDTELPSYSKLSENEKSDKFGVIVKDGQKTVYYRDHLALRTDLLAFYGIKQLTSMI